MTAKESVKHDISLCRHCQEPVPKGSRGEALYVDRKGSVFCCKGCQAAWLFIHEIGLSSYYELLQRVGTAAIPVSEEPSLTPALFDDPAFQRSFFVGDNPAVARLHIGGLSCYACVWLCENALASAFPGVRASLNLARGRADITFDPAKYKLSQIVALLMQLGFRVSPASDKKEPDDRRDVVRLGVAVVCAMNVMGFALADYLAPAGGDLSNFYFHLFRWLSLVVALPAFAYAAIPFYVAAYRATRLFKISIDQGITFSIVVAFGYSVVNVWRGVGHVYFDSICAGISLLLAGRVIQKMVLRRADDTVRALFRPSDDFVRIVEGAQNESVKTLRDIRCADKLRILPGELLPVNCAVVSGQSEVSLERMTGEPGFSPVGFGAEIRGGAVNGFGELIVEARESGASSWHVAAEKSIESMLGDKSRFIALSERFAAWFFVGVTSIAVGAVIFHWRSPVGPEEAVARAIAIILIACPCAFGIAGPLSLARGAARALRSGVLFRSPTAIERAADVRFVIFDKTGTLTDGVYTVKEVVWSDIALGAKHLTQPEAVALLRDLVAVSDHHWARAIKSWLSGNCEAAIDELVPTTENQLVDQRETFGSGIEGRWQTSVVKLGRSQFAANLDSLNYFSQSTLQQRSAERFATFLTVDGDIIAAFAAEDRILPESSTMVTKLQNLGLESSILSGDGEARTREVATALGINTYAGNLSPEAKSIKVSENKKGSVAMVGNGFNDSLALAGAHLGVAVFGASPAAREAADVYLAAPGQHLIVDIFRFARATMTNLRLAYLFAATYNITGVLLAWTGYVTPGFAAAIMPLSSLMIVRLATWGGLSGFSDRAHRNQSDIRLSRRRRFLVGSS